MKCAAMSYIGALTCVIILANAVSALAAEELSAKDLTYITEQLPPYSYYTDGKLQGISIDLLERIWERMGVNLNSSAIQLLPWSEAYNRTLEENNAVLFITARLPQREELFKWAGPLLSGKSVLLAKKDKHIRIAASEDLKNYRIGAIRDDASFQLLLDKGLKEEDLMLETTSAPIIEMLENGSIDAWAYSSITGIWEIQESGKNISNYEEAYALGNIDGYLAFSKDVPDPLVHSFQEAIEYIKSNRDANGVSDYEYILANYDLMME
jgi:polar amino acid transport system substrate-binding protein